MKVQMADSFFESIKRINRTYTWWYKTYSFFRYELPHFFRNLWAFRKELWEYRSWDYRFSLNMFKKSLEPLADRLENGYEVDESRLKKVKMIRRVIEILDRQDECKYIEMAELELGAIISKDIEFKKISEDQYEPIFNESPEEREHNKKVYDRAYELEEAQWKELWQILEGQDPKEYKKYLESKTEEELKKTDVWYQWFDGTGIRGWWD